MKEPVEKCVARVAEEAGRRFGFAPAPGSEVKLGAFAAELVRWNRSINLTSITEPEAVAELHFLDSLAVVPLVPEGATVLDVGTGGGFPGVPLAAVRPDLQITLVDRTEKKILFLKTTLARLGIANARPAHLRLEGNPAAEGLAPFDVAVSRAFAAPEDWLPLARAYVKPGGRIIAMLGADQPGEPELGEALGGDRVIAFQRYVLPSGHQRALLVVERAL